MITSSIVKPTGTVNPAGVTQALLICSGLLVCSLVLMTIRLDAGIKPLATSALVWVTMVVLIKRAVGHHPHSTFGIANSITTFRAAGTALLAALIPIAHTSSLFDPLQATDFLWGLSIAVIVLLALDGVDGYLARRTRLDSPFGARFDMEVDAFLALILAVLIWRSGKAGVWVLGLGTLRYLFILASVWSAALRGELFHSVRRKVVCVMQIAALCLMLSPLLTPTFVSAVGIIALLCLLGSFAIDVWWLHNQFHQQARRLSSSSPITPGNAAISDTSP